MLLPIHLLLLTTLYQLVACLREKQQKPPGQLVDMGGYALHLYRLGKGGVTIVIDHSLGGVKAIC